MFYVKYDLTVNESGQWNADKKSEGEVGNEERSFLSESKMKMPGLFVKKEIDHIGLMIVFDSENDSCSVCGSKSIATRFPINSCSTCMSGRRYLVAIERAMRSIMR